MSHSDVAIVVTLKVNSAKQAKERFLKKYGSSLTGNWNIKIKSEDGVVLSNYTKKESGWELSTPSEDLEAEINKLILDDFTPF